MKKASTLFFLSFQHGAITTEEMRRRLSYIDKDKDNGKDCKSNLQMKLRHNKKDERKFKLKSNLSKEQHGFNAMKLGNRACLGWGLGLGRGWQEHMYDATLAFSNFLMYILYTVKILLDML